MVEKCAFISNACIYFGGATQTRLSKLQVVKEKNEVDHDWPKNANQLAFVCQKKIDVWSSYVFIGHSRSIVLV